MRKSPYFSWVLPRLSNECHFSTSSSHVGGKCFTSSCHNILENKSQTYICTSRASHLECSFTVGLLLIIVGKLLLIWAPWLIKYTASYFCCRYFHFHEFFEIVPKMQENLLASPPNHFSSIFDNLNFLLVSCSLGRPICDSPVIACMYLWWKFFTPYSFLLVLNACVKSYLILCSMHHVSVSRV